MKQHYFLFVAAMLLFGGFAQAQYLTIGTGTDLGRGNPFDTYWRHSVSQMIYTPEDMGNQAVKIHAIAWHQNVTEAVPAQLHHMKVYMTMTSRSSFNSDDGWNNNGNGGTLYYDGEFYVSDRDEWTTITLDDYFIYNGTSNVIITVIDDIDDEVDGEDLNSEHKFYCSTTSDYKCLYARNDNDPYDGTNFGSVEGDVSNMRPNIRFFTTSTSETELPHIEIGDGSTSSENSSNYLPNTILYNNSISEQLFTNAELGGNGTKLYGVQFYKTSTDSDIERRNVKVYLSSTSSTEYANETDWTQVVSWELLYKGGFAIPEEEGWVTIWFNEPKSVAGGNNYALVVVDSNDFWRSSRYYATHTTSGNTSIINYSDETAFDAPALYHSDIEGELLSIRNNVRFILDATPQTSITEAGSVNVNVYPNPTNGRLTVKANGLKHVDLLNVTGKTLVSTNNATLDLSNLPAGVYMLRVQTEEGTSMQKIIKN